MINRLLRVVALLVAFACFHARAWTGTGHMIIAAEAFRHLSAADRAKVTGILKAHPEFDKWQESFQLDPPGFDLEAFIFMKASTWPDEIRRKHSQYDHPQWHYIDYPLRAPSIPFEPGPAPTNDALFGIAQCEKTLSDSGAPAELRAVYLSYLVHLIGDIHQPLHCASLFSDKYPHGDKGGNDFYVRPGERGIKLHALWDGLLGTADKPNRCWEYAVKLDSQFRKRGLKELKKAKSPKQWSLESRAVAMEKAYLHGALKGSTSAQTAPSLPDGYTGEAKAVGERQAALAGYRLAKELSKALK